ncbi:MAG: translation initiation factor [Proteobacteria bacterium]|nr:translation initiation factor [Pseudomonadota bacterium]
MADKIVYSTEPPKPGKNPQPSPVYLSLIRGGKGSGVTRVEGLIMSHSQKEELLRKYKSRFGCGGTLKDNAIEVQGDRRDAIEAELRSAGYQTKRKGG